MKNAAALFFFAFVILLSCRPDEGGLQQIDQVLHIYLDSAKTDMLNNNIPGAYRSFQVNDVYGITDNAPVSLSLKKDGDTISYLEYVAGAKRMIIDSSALQRTYESKLAFAFIKKKNDSTNVTINDTMRIRYSWTPQLFRVETVYYNNQLKYTNADETPHIVRITK